MGRSPVTTRSRDPRGRVTEEWRRERSVARANGVQRDVSMSERRVSPVASDWPKKTWSDYSSQVEKESGKEDGDPNDDHSDDSD